MYLAVEFDHYKWNEMSQEDYNEVRAAVPSLPAERSSWIHGTHIVTQAAVPLLVKHEISFHLSRDEKSQGIGTMLVKLQDRINALEMRNDDSLAKLADKGCAVQIAIPDLGLLSIREVTWLEDACTENLQHYLDDGWRILAVCPPNAQRRPDYILGRSRHAET